MAARKTIIGGATILASLLMPVFAYAQTLHITPTLIDASHSLEEALMKMKSHASTTVKGKGGILEITYESSDPLEIYMVPMQAGDNYVPTDYMRFTLPETDDGTIDIDLTVSPGWTSGNQKWLINLLSREELTKAAFTDISFNTHGTSNIVLVAFRHLFQKESYTPGSYHALRGYRMLGISLTKTLGMLAIVITLACFALLPSKRYRYGVLLTLLIASLLYQARFSVDLLRYSWEHENEYAAGTYDEAGSIHAVADSIRSLAKDPAKTTVYVCRDGTNFKEKLLRYFTYPVRVSSEPETAKNADYVVVMDKFSWSFDTSVTKEQSSVTLHCGGVDGTAQRLNTFPSGEILFALPTPRSSAAVERSGVPLPSAL